MTVNTGTHSVGETAGTATSLGDYVSSIECRDEDGEGDVVTSASGSGPLDVEVAEDDDIVCTITNKRKATVTVIKDARPEDGTDFAFTATGPGLSGFTLDDDADPALSNTKVFSGLGTFGPGSVSEQVPAGWSNTSASCTGTEGSSEGSTVSFSIDPGDNITCTFVNKKDAKVTIVKDAIPDDEQDFSFSGDFGAFQLDDDGDGTLPSSRTFTVAGDDFGVYQVSETPAGGWTLTDITCTPEGTDGGNTATLDVDPGDNITCKFTNARDTGQLEVVKNVVSDDPM